MQLVFSLSNNVYELTLFYGVEYGPIVQYAVRKKNLRRFLEEIKKRLENLQVIKRRYLLYLRMIFLIFHHLLNVCLIWQELGMTLSELTQHLIRGRCDDLKNLR